MADLRNVIATVSVVIALASSAWAYHATRQSSGGNGPGAPPAFNVAAGTASSGGPFPGARGPGGLGGAPAFGAGAAVAVVTAPVRSELIEERLTALGTARANEAVEITAKTSNIVTALKFREGERVRRGQILVELDSARARADLAEAQATLAESESQLNRSRGLLATQVVSQSQFEQLEAKAKADAARLAAAQAALEDTVIRAPFDGRVGLRRVSVGSLINPGTVITTLDDTSVIKVDFAIPENSIGGLREGLPITARSPAFPGRELAGRVTSVDSRIDPTTRSVTVRAVVPNPENLLKPGMFLNVTLTTARREALVIPEEALVPDQSRQFVFLVENGRAVRREVRIGSRQPGLVEVVAGLSPTDRVVIEGTQKVRDGGPVRDLYEPPTEVTALEIRR